MKTLIKVNDWSREDARREYLAFWNEMKVVVALTVRASFAKAKMRNPTFTEIKHRTDVAKTLVDEMRQDLKWSKQRITDLLPLALDARIVGLAFDLDALARRGTW